MTADQIEARLGDPASARSLLDKGGYPAGEEIEQLLDPLGQTIRGTGARGETGG